MRLGVEAARNGYVSGSLTRQHEKLAPCSLVEPGICWVRDVLLHHRDLDHDFLQMTVLHRPGALSGLDRLGHPTNIW
jgi:hypothetical protein